jgi:cell division protease FtsH
MTNGFGPHDPGAVAELDELPVLDPSTAYRVTDRVVRPPMSFWDRAKLLFLFFGLWWVLLWAALSNNPIEPFSAAVGNELKALWWLEGLFGLEVVRQIHYLISERSAGWHRFWSEGVFGGLNRFTHRINDWNRYRIGRAMKVVFFLAILAVILAGFFHTSPFVSLFQVPAAVISALPLLLQLLLYVGIILLQFVALFWFLSRGGIDTYFPGDVRTRFTDVWGQDAVLERVKESIIYLKDPDEIESRGGYVPGGILLWGPPGTGKTLIAEAVAGETHNPFVFVDPGAFTNMFMGVGILKVKGLFRKLRKLALRYGGVVVFFDEADSLGNRGSLAGGQGVFGPNPMREPGPWEQSGCRGAAYMDPAIHNQVMSLSSPFDPPDDGPVQRHRMMAGMMGGGGMGTLQSLLSELSGLKKPRGVVNRVVRRTLGFPPKPPPKYRIMVMMATNMPESLDEALLRPGRIDRIYKVGYPSKAGRVRTYQGYFSKVKHELTAENLERLATVTPYATGATIKDLVNESLINAIRGQREAIVWDDVVKAKQMKELGPPEDVEYVERERHAVAIHEACHAVAAATVSRDVVIDVATIEKGGSYLGLVSHVRVEDTFTRWNSDYEGQVMVALASLAGEKMFFAGDNSSGVSSDLATATRTAVFMEGYWGMGRTVASHGITREAGIGGEGPNDRRRRESQMLSGGLGTRIEAKLEELLERTRVLLDEHRLQVLAVAHALEQFKTVTGEDVVAIMTGTQGPLIDGARYHTDEFRVTLEEYHTKMVAAHESRAQAHIEFPVLPVAVRDPAEVPAFADHEAVEPTH